MLDQEDWFMLIYVGAVEWLEFDANTAATVEMEIQIILSKTGLMDCKRLQRC